MPSAAQVRIGTRGSALARWQAQWVAQQLTDAGVEIEMVVVTTQGDMQSGPVGNLGGVGVFTKEIQRALLDDRIDLAVHSLKDLPTESVEGLTLAAVPPRERCGDALVSRAGTSLDELPAGSVIGTGSMRRHAQLKYLRPDITIADIRGNVETRLQKLDDGDYDAVLLAEAGLARLGLAQRITQILPKETFLPAVGQGALGLETREQDAAVRNCLSVLDDPASHCAVIAERAALAALRGGCLAPVGAWGRVEGDVLTLDAVVLNGDGTRRVTATASGAAEDALELGRQVAQNLLNQGAADLIAAARSR